MSNVAQEREVYERRAHFGHSRCKLTLKCSALTTLGMTFGVTVVGTYCWGLPRSRTDILARSAPMRRSSETARVHCACLVALCNRSLATRNRPTASGGWAC